MQSFPAERSQMCRVYLQKWKLERDARELDAVGRRVTPIEKCLIPTADKCLRCTFLFVKDDKNPCTKFIAISQAT